MIIIKFINRFLIQLLMGSILAGLLFGYLFPGLGATLQPFYPLCMFVMLFPMVARLLEN
jgi:ACR3 family arsenite transporter